MIYYIAHVSPGGREGETYIQGMQLFAFLCSPLQRVSVSLLASLYPVQMEWAQFFDGKTKIDNKTACISTRIMEGVIFNNKILRWVHDVKRNWKGVFKTTVAYIDHCEWNSTEDKQACIHNLEEIMTIAVPKMDLKANEYFRCCLIYALFVVIFHSYILIN